MRSPGLNHKVMLKQRIILSEPCLTLFGIQQDAQIHWLAFSHTIQCRIYQKIDIIVVKTSCGNEMFKSWGCLIGMNNVT